MTITALPEAPSTSDPTNFASEADAWVAALDNFVDEFNTDIAALNNISTTSTSVTSNTIGTGSKSFTVATGKSYFVGMSLTIARTSAPANRMFAYVDSYNSGTGALVVTSQAFEGSGTFTDWTITLGFNGVISNAQLSNSYINDLTVVTFDPNADYVAISDGSDSGNKKKAFIRDIVLGTPIATTSGTSHDFSSIPSWVKRITVNFSGVSTNGTSALIIQIGDSGGIETSGYLSSAYNIGGATTVNATGGYAVTSTNAAAAVYHGSYIISLLDAATNTWAGFGNLGQSNTANMVVSGGSKPLSATLDRLRLTTAAGVDTFDAGSINILYE